MPNQTAKPLTMECGVAELSSYLVDSRAGVVALLGTLHKAGSLVTAYFSGGNNFVITSIVAMHPERDEVILEYGADAAANQRALHAKRLTFVATHERIKIQFYTTSLRQTRFQGRDAFSMPLPDAMLRLQRREYFRITTPLARPLKCLIKPQDAAARAPVQVTIVDISCGGIAITAATDAPDIKTGVCFRGCQIPLPELGTVVADILLKSTYEVTLRNGARQKQVGCEFISMPERERAKIQRYINKLERERKSRNGAG